MVWYGYVYYILFNLITLSFVFALLRMYLSTYVNHWFSIFILNRVFLSIILFFFFLSFTVLNYSLDYSELILFSTFSFNSATSSVEDVFLSTYVSNYSSPKLWSLTTNSLNLVQVYTYPFIYVFLVVTILSIVYCLSYNIDDLVSFMFYCQLILLAGYALFYTDSIILFFYFTNFYLYLRFLYYISLLKHVDVLKLRI